MIYQIVTKKDKNFIKFLKENYSIQIKNLEENSLFEYLNIMVNLAHSGTSSVTNGSCFSFFEKSEIERESLKQFFFLNRHFITFIYDKGDEKIKSLLEKYNLKSIELDISDKSSSFFKIFNRYKR